MAARLEARRIQAVVSRCHRQPLRVGRGRPHLHRVIAQQFLVEVQRDLTLRNWRVSGRGRALSLAGEALDVLRQNRAVFQFRSSEWHFFVAVRDRGCRKRKPPPDRLLGTRVQTTHVLRSEGLVPTLRPTHTPRKRSIIRLLKWRVSLRFGPRESLVRAASLVVCGSLPWISRVVGLGNECLRWRQGKNDPQVSEQQKNA